MSEVARLIFAILAMLAFWLLSMGAPDGSIEKAAIQVSANIWTATVIILVAIGDDRK